MSEDIFALPKYLFNIILKNQYENVTHSTLLVISDHFKPLYSKLTSILDTVLIAEGNEDALHS